MAALIAKLPGADDPYQAALAIMGGALDVIDSPEVGSRLYLLWARFTDWVELEPGETPEALVAMRAAAREWPRVRNDAAALDAYFNHWMIEVMGARRALPPGWTMRVDEVSAGVYRATAEAADGRSVAASGTNPLDLTSEVRRQVSLMAEG